MSHAEKQAVRLWQECICLIWHGRCARCGSTYKVAGHHITYRDHAACKFVLMNGIALCSGCHASAHDMPIEFMLWLEIAYPKHYAWHEEHKHDTKMKWSHEMKATVTQLREAKHTLEGI